MAVLVAVPALGLEEWGDHYTWSPAYLGVDPKVFAQGYGRENPCGASRRTCNLGINNDDNDDNEAELDCKSSPCSSVTPHPRASSLPAHRARPPLLGSSKRELELLGRGGRCRGWGWGAQLSPAPPAAPPRERPSPPPPAPSSLGEEGRRRLGSGGQVWGPIPN